MVRLGVVLLLSWPASVVSEVMTSANLRLGDGTEASVGTNGNVNQPYYKNAEGEWKKLTFQTNGLDFALHYDGAASIPGTATITYDAGTATVVQTAGFVTLTRTYSLAGAIFTTKMGVCANQGVKNVEIWCGTQDDWIGDTDQVLKTIGKFTGGAFQAAPDGAVVKLTSGSEGVFLLTTAPGAKGLLGDVDWENIEGKSVCAQEELTNHQGKTTDGSYGIYLPVGDIAQGSCKEAEMRYAAGSADDLASIADSIATPATPTAAPTPNSTAAPPKKGTTSSSDPRRVTHVPLFFVLALVAFH